RRIDLRRHATTTAIGGAGLVVVPIGANALCAAGAALTDAVGVTGVGGRRADGSVASIGDGPAHTRLAGSGLLAGGRRRRAHAAVRARLRRAGTANADGRIVAEAGGAAYPAIRATAGADVRIGGIRLGNRSINRIGGRVAQDARIWFGIDVL